MCAIHDSVEKYKLYEKCNQSLLPAETEFDKPYA